MEKRGKKKAKKAATPGALGTKRRKNAMVNALKDALGIVTTACDNVGVTRETHYKWMREDEEYKARVEDLDDVSLDFGETQLYKRMREGSDASIIFYLKTKGKKRGYIEQHNFEHKVKEMPHMTVIKMNDSENPYE